MGNYSNSIRWAENQLVLHQKDFLKEAVKKNYFQKVEFVSNKQKIHSNHKYASHKEKF
jgi:hypothetical protein